MYPNQGTLKIPLHPINEFSRAFVEAFSRKVIAKRAVGIKELEGKFFEQICCEIYGVEWRGSNTGLTDALIDVVGYSMKSKLHNVKGDLAKDSRGKYRRISTIVGRNSPDTHDGSHIQKHVTPAKQAGEMVVNIWNERLKDAQQLCQEFRQLTILKSSDLSRWLLFEFEPRPFDAADFDWQWANGRSSKKKSVNLYGINDTYKLTWQPNGAQFTLNQQIPPKHLKIILKEDVPVIPEEEILRQVGYADNWMNLESNEFELDD